MRERKIPSQIQQRVLKYLEYVHHKNQSSYQQGEQIIQKLTPKIREDLYQYHFGNILRQNKLLSSKFSEELL